MKAAVVHGPGVTPVFADFREPTASDGGEVIIDVSAAALSNFSRGRAMGSHYSADNAFPAVAGSDGVGRTAEGTRVYFALPEAPFGSMAEKSLVRRTLCIPVPDDVDDVTAAAIANAGMSVWAGLFTRAHMTAGETVLVNGATGTAGRLAVQLAKFKGAKKVIATGRNAAELESLKELGADAVIPFDLGGDNESGAKEFEERLAAEFAFGVDVVLDYLWGVSAKTIVVAIAKSVEDATPVRFVHMGEAGGEPTIALPGAALRSSAIVLMGSGVKSVPMAGLLDAIANVFAVVREAKLEIATQVHPLSEVEGVWKTAGGKPRVVFTV